MDNLSRRSFVRTAAVAGAGLVAPRAGGASGRMETASVLPRRRFGKSGVEVTMIGLGGGSRFYLPVPDDEAGAELVRKAVDRGIEFIETGANYGPNAESERRIGMAMKTHRSKVFLETKVDARDYDGAMKEMERSLERLQTDRLDLVLHHFLTGGEELDKVSAAGGAEAAIRKMVDQKVVRFRGFSCHSPDLTLDGLTRLEPDAIQIIVNATRVPDFEARVLPVTEARGVAVVAMKSCGKGYFLRHNFTKPDRIDQYGPPHGVFDDADLPSARDYLRYTLSLPVSTVVVGIDCMETVDSLLNDVAGFVPLGTAARERLAQKAEVFRTTGFWLPQPAQDRVG